MVKNVNTFQVSGLLVVNHCRVSTGSAVLSKSAFERLGRFTNIRGGVQSFRKPAIFSPLKIRGREGVQPDFGKIETKDRYHDE